MLTSSVSELMHFSSPSQKYFCSPDEIKVKNQSEDVWLGNICSWRQKTALPVVRVENFETDKKQYWYPKTYHIVFEPIQKKLGDLFSI